MILIEIIEKLMKITMISSLMIVAILFVRMLLSKKVKTKYIYLLWVLLLVRLVFPFENQSSWSAEKIVEKPLVYIHEQREEKVPVFENKAIEYSDIKKEVYQGRTTYESVLYILGYVWLFGCFVVVFTPAISYLTLKKMLNQSHDSMNDELKALITSIRRRLGISRHVDIKINHFIDGPALIGIFKPIIVLPYELSDLPADQLEQIIVHEMTHLKLHHLLIQWVFWMVKAIYWFNPLVWIAHELMKQDAELMCDDKTLEVLGEGHKESYGHLLIDISEMTSRSSFAINASGLINKKSELRRRIMHLQRKKSYSVVYKILFSGLFIFIGLTCFTSLALDKEESYLISWSQEESVPYDIVEYANIQMMPLSSKYDEVEEKFSVEMAYEIKGDLVETIDDCTIGRIDFNLTFPQSYSKDARDQRHLASVKGDKIVGTKGVFTIVFDHVTYEPSEYGAMKLGLVYIVADYPIQKEVTFPVNDIPNEIEVNDEMVCQLVEGRTTGNEFFVKYDLDAKTPLTDYNFSTDITLILKDENGFEKQVSGSVGSNGQSSFSGTYNYEDPILDSDNMTIFFDSIAIHVLVNFSGNKDLGWYLETE